MNADSQKNGLPDNRNIDGSYTDQRPGADLTDKVTTNKDNASEYDPGMAPPKEFEISPDLNISPVLTKSEETKSIPLRDMTQTLNAIHAAGIKQPKTVIVPPEKMAPANPPAKTIGIVGSMRPQSEPRDLQSAVAEITTPATPTQTNPDQIGPKNIRTYEGDIAEVMSHKKSSRASIVIAEDDRKRDENPENNEAIADEKLYIGKKIAITSLSLVLIIAGIIGAYYLYSLSPLYHGPTSTNTQAQRSSSIITSDSQSIVKVDDTNSYQILDEIEDEVDKGMPGNTVREIVLTKTVDEKLYRITAREAIELFGLDIPDILNRSTTDDWMLGIFNDNNDRKSVFVITTNNFFQNAFAGMLQWEPLIADDLKSYLYPSATGITSERRSTSMPPESSLVFDTLIGTTSTTSTPLTSSSSMNLVATTTETQEFITPSFTLRGQFKDRIVKNRDVREFVTADGRILFLYSFIDNSKLVMTNNEATLAELISRLDKQSLMH